MENIKNYLTNLPNQFWVNNGLASFLYFFINGSQDWLSLLVFPVVIAVLDYLLSHYFTDINGKEYLGFFPLEHEPQALIISALLNLVVWYLGIFILLFSLVYIYLKENRA